MAIVAQQVPITRMVHVASAPPGTDEPVYNGGTDTLVYQDGFDTYAVPVDGSGTPNQATFPTTARFQTNGTYSTDPAVFMSASISTDTRTGTGRCLRSNNTRGTEGGSPQSGGIDWLGPQGTFSRPSSTTAKHVFQYWYKCNGTWSGTNGSPGNQGCKYFEWWSNGTALPSGDTRMQLGPYTGASGWTPNGHNPYTLNDTQARILAAGGGSVAQPVSSYFDQTLDSQWHRLTIAWQSPTGVATRDGYARVWLDGTKIIDLSQSTVGVTPSGGTKAWCIQGEVDAMPSFKMDHFLCWPSHTNSAVADWTLWIDDFSWWTQP